MTRIFLVAGEASGDLHGGLLARALLRRRPDLELTGIGGEEMALAGVRLILRSEEIAVVGFLEVLSRMRAILRALGAARRHIEAERPALFVPIDFPDFNFRLLGTAKRCGVPVGWYISPQVWAWRGERVETLRRHVQRMLVIFPFEPEFYRKQGMEATWVGHPLLDVIERPNREGRDAMRQRLGVPLDLPVIALLPGSRPSEVTRIAPLLARARERIDAERRGRGAPAATWIVGRAHGLREGLLSPLLTGETILASGRDALAASDLAIAASGTVTLEAALLEVPTIVVYRTHPLTFALARRLVRVPHIAMANLVAERRLLPELLQDEASPEAIAVEARRLLDDHAARQEVLAGLSEVRTRLGTPGAPDRAAAALLELLGNG